MAAGVKHSTLSRSLDSGVGENCTNATNTCAFSGNLFSDLYHSGIRDTNCVDRLLKTPRIPLQTPAPLQRRCTRELSALTAAGPCLRSPLSLSLSLSLSLFHWGSHKAEAKEQGECRCSQLLRSSCTHADLHPCAPSSSRSSLGPLPSPVVFLCSLAKPAPYFDDDDDDDTSATSAATVHSPVRPRTLPEQSQDACSLESFAQFGILTGSLHSMQSSRNIWNLELASRSLNSAPDCEFCSWRTGSATVDFLSRFGSITSRWTGARSV